MDNVSSKHKGYDIDLIIIEKEDISLSFTEFANDGGLVIRNTRGFIVEYADVVALDDCDAYGFRIVFEQVPWMSRIGVDFKDSNNLDFQGRIPQTKIN
jgi:hypothetical protein